ncbi:MAG TPA: pyridoxamine 5'-phosphate oxidase [Gaiellaceae bacterium]|nr:pyridoxamine 5'-phosphate oxidase [Gaiellaceae bacterium]
MTDPIELFNEVFEGDAIALATASRDGRPSARMVLLKAAADDGFVFFSNYESRKGRELAENPHAAMLYHGDGVQLRIEGPVERLSDPESDAYWATRPAGSRRSAAASRQSQPVASRADLEAAVAAQPAEPPRPAHWGGYRLIPQRIEHWQHRDDRLHERHLYERAQDGWSCVMLQP